MITLDHLRAFALAQPVSADDAASRDRRLGFVRTDPIAPGMEPDPAPSGQGLRRGGPRTPLSAPSGVNYGSCRRDAGADKSARREQVWPAARRRSNRAVLDFVRARGVDASAGGGRRVRARQDAQLVRRFEQCEARSCSMACTTAACCALPATRGRVRLYARATRRRRPQNPAAALDALFDVAKSPSTRRCRRRRSGGSPAASASARPSGAAGDAAMLERAGRGCPRCGSTASTGTGRRARTGAVAPPAGRAGAPARRSTGGLGPAASGVLGLGLPLRGLRRRPRRVRGYARCRCCGATR